jgi:hypothetical protein
MTAEEIRAHGADRNRKANIGGTEIGSLELEHNRDDWYWLREIAAQLAELNVHMGFIGERLDDIRGKLPNG